MDKIQVRDREFTISIPEAKILQRVSEVARQIQHDLKDEHPLFISVLNGSFVFAADLLRAVDMPCEVTFVRVASYEGMGSTGKVKQLMGLKENIEGRTSMNVALSLPALRRSITSRTFASPCCDTTTGAD